MGAFDKDNLRFILEEETDADSPVSEELISQMRENFEALMLLLLGHGDYGTFTSDPPNDTTGVLTDSAASYDADEHNGRTILITSGTAKGTYINITDTTTTTIVVSGTNFYSLGVRSGDSYKILYTINTGVNTGHNHNSLNSETVVPASATITANMLKTTTQTVTVTDTSMSGNSGHFELIGGAYCFYPKTKFYDDTTGVSGVGSAQIVSALDNTITVYTTLIYLEAYCSPSATYGTMGALTRYVTNSGEINWLFLLRDYQTSQIISRWFAPDHPCYGNGGKPLITQHPFADVFEENGGLYRWIRDPETRAITDQKQRVEIICINPDMKDIEKIEKKRIVEDESLPNLDWMQAFDEIFDIDESKTGDWPDIPVTVGLPKLDEDGNIIDDWRFAPKNTRLKPIKKIIPKPNLVEVIKYKVKA